jgi:hypothetical protein
MRPKDSAPPTCGTPTTAHNDLPVATRIWTDHVESNKTRGVTARAIKLAARAAKIGDTSAAAKVALKRDYEKNLY